MQIHNFINYCTAKSWGETVGVSCVGVGWGGWGVDVGLPRVWEENESASRS